MIKQIHLMVQILVMHTLVHQPEKYDTHQKYVQIHISVSNYRRNNGDGVHVLQTKSD